MGIRGAYGNEFRPEKEEEGTRKTGNQKIKRKAYNYSHFQGQREEESDEEEDDSGIRAPVNDIYRQRQQKKIRWKSNLWNHIFVCRKISEFCVRSMRAEQ